MFLRKKEFVFVGLILVLTVAVFSQTFSNYFTNWDDTYYLAFDGIRNFDLHQIFTATLVNNYFPFVLFGYAVDAQICYPDAWCFHLSSLLLHLGNVVLLYLLIRRVFRNDLWLAVLTSLIFAIHPLQVEAVAWMSAKNYPQSFLFVLGTVHFYLSSQKKHQTRFYLLALLCFAIGLLTKNVVFVTPLILWAIDYFHLQKRNIRLLLPFFVGSVLAGGAALLLYGEENGLNAAVAWTSPFEKAAFFAQSLIFYFGKAFLPFNLSAFYDFFSQDVFWYDYLGVSVLILVFTASLAKGLWRSRDWQLLTVFVFILLFPFLKIVSFNDSSSFNDRYMYYSIGFVWLWALYSMAKLTPKKVLPILVGLVLVSSCFYSYISYRRVFVWENPTTLWGDVLHQNPTSAAARFKLAELYLNIGDWETSLEQTKLGLKNPSRYSAALYYLQAQAYQNLRQPTKAIESLDQGLKINPDFTPAKKLRDRLLN